MRIRYFSLVPLLAAASPALAQEVPLAEPLPDTQITVVATGGATRIDQAGQSISVIGADEIDAVQGPDIVRVL